MYGQSLIWSEPYTRAKRFTCMLSLAHQVASPYVVLRHTMTLCVSVIGTKLYAQYACNAIEDEWWFTLNVKVDGIT